ncbi:MAG: PIG-L family deacetylase [Bacteroidota bacterium]|nr:PIG-L family deacetylase [Bacteroidota bacterium]
MLQLSSKSVAIIVAHPDDEILWAGGSILSNPLWKCFIVCLCRKNDSDRAPRFLKSLEALRSEGIMGDLDDGPDQVPLDVRIVGRAILKLLPAKHYDLVVTHSFGGEYTRHVRHEEVGKAVIHLWETGKISASELWAFAYEDGKQSYFPKPIETGTLYFPLSQEVWLEKYRLITETYGFDTQSWEAQTTPHAEAFYKYTDPMKAKESIKVDDDSV